MLWRWRIIREQNIQLTDHLLANTVLQNMQLQCLYLAIDRENMALIPKEKKYLRNFTLVILVENCWLAEWNFRLILKWYMKEGETSSVDSVIKHLPQNPTYKFMRDPCIQVFFPTNVNSAVKCSPGEINYKVTRNLSTQVMLVPSTWWRMSTRSRWRTSWSRWRTVWRSAWALTRSISWRRWPSHRRSWFQALLNINFDWVYCDPNAHRDL